MKTFIAPRTTRTILYYTKSLVIGILLCLLIPSSGYASARVGIDGIYYFLDDNTKTATVTSRFGQDPMDADTPISFYSGDVIIPSSVTYEGNTYKVTSIGYMAFTRSKDLTSIVIPNSVKTINYRAFNGCRGLTSLIIPNGVTYIDEYAFSHCDGLISLTIPKSVTEFGWEVFANCTSLKSILVEHEAPLNIYSELFYQVDRANCTLYVPVGSKSAYESAPVWSEFENIVEVVTDISTLDNAIYVDQVDGLVGGTIDIPVMMKSDFDVRGFQFTMELPVGTTINSWQVNPDRLPSGISASKVLPMERIEGNRIVATCVLNDGNKTFTGNEGVIATVNVTFGSNIEAGTYPIYLTEASISDASSTNQKVLSGVKANLVLDDYVVGDTNGDGKVLIGDVIAILNYIVGDKPEDFNEKAADVNGDGLIVIGDVIAALNIIVGK